MCLISKYVIILVRYWFIIWLLVIWLWLLETTASFLDGTPVQVVAVLSCLSLAVDCLPAPAPAPQPFFGLGLLGRLLAAYSSGAKEEDFGNCKCNRRTFHNKPEKEKDKANI